MAKIKEDIVPSFMDFGRFKPIMSMTKQNFKEMQQFFLMKIIAGYPNGITAYQIKNDYHFPRSNVIRHLNDLEKENMVVTDERIVDGRANKVFTLTPAGFNHLVEMKERWKERFAMMEELTSNFTQAERDHYIGKIEMIKTREDKIKFLKHMRQNIDNKIENLREKEELLSEMSGQISRIINTIENMEHCGKDELEALFDMLPGKN